MVSYEVTLGVDPGSSDRVEAYMRGRHIPEILATGCFLRISLERSGDGRLRTRYVAETREDLERYLREHTADLRADFLAHFPTGAVATREEWDVLEAWVRPIR